MRESLSDLCKLLEHANGYKRENAVRRVGMLQDPIALPNLLIRVNDWVPQIRGAAKEAILRMRISENAPAFVDCLPNIYHLEICGRENHSGFIAEITSFLVSRDNKHALIRALLSKKPKVARYAAKLALENYPDERESIALTCLRHSDVVLRDIAADNFRYISVANLPTVFELALKDSYMPVRREAFQIYLRTNPSEKTRIAHDYLFDRHFSIREIAIKTFENSCTEVKGIYVSVLRDKKASILQTNCSISGLAYLQAKEETPNILSYLDDKTPTIRKSVAQALEKMHGDKYTETYIRLLNDESPSVAKEALRLIQKLKIRFNSNDISNVLQLPSYPHTFALTLRAMRTSNKWERLIFMLNTMGNTTVRESKNYEILRSEISSWDHDFNRSYVEPTQQQSEVIKVEYENCARSLEPHVKESIEFTLKTMKIIQS